jgi:hypothetical protein
MFVNALPIGGGGRGETDEATEVESERGALGVSVDENNGNVFRKGDSCGT